MCSFYSWIKALGVPYCFINFSILCGYGLSKNTYHTNEHMQTQSYKIKIETFCFDYYRKWIGLKLVENEFNNEFYCQEILNSTRHLNCTIKFEISLERKGRRERKRNVGVGGSNIGRNRERKHVCLCVCIKCVPTLLYSTLTMYPIAFDFKVS